MHILIAPDKFKGSLSARQVAENIAFGIRDVIPNAQIEITPVADGGEGTTEVIHDSLGGEWVTCAAHDALGGRIEARYVWIRDQGAAVMEMSEAAGMRRLKDGVRDIMCASTLGVGEMLLDATKGGAREIIVGLGCDFRNNPGAGAAGGLGFGLMSFCDAELRPGFDVVADIVELEEKIKATDVVITGEGKLDTQTLEGKAPAGVARLARKFGKRVFAVVGHAQADQQAREIFEGVYELGGSIPQARELLRERARQLGSALKD